MQAVLFDFNGTLFDDTRLHVAAWHDFMRGHFGREFSARELHDHFIGPNNEQIFRRCFGQDVTQAQMQAWSEEKEALYRAAARADRARFHLIDGAPELFEALIARGVRMAVATSSLYPNVRFYMDELGLGKWFDLEHIVYEDGRLAAKPAPDFYLEAARRVGVDPGACVVVEDTPTGFLAAANARVGRIVAIDTTLTRKALEGDPRLGGVIHNFYDFERYI